VSLRGKESVMDIPLYQVDAFTNTLFKGNPAAVCPLESWPSDDVLQAVAAENNLSETAFFAPRDDGGYDLRWLTPAMEVDLCGHATLASAYAIFRFLEPSRSSVRFETRSGPLTVERDGARLSMTFPARPGEPCPPPNALVEGLGVRPLETLLARDYLAVLDSREAVEALRPHHDRLLELEGLGVIVTAGGKDEDFVSRFFAPKAGVPEDPVTGSAHCTLVPYWAAKLGKKNLHARQISSRGGELFCEDLGDRVRMAGEAVLYLEGRIRLPE